MTRVGCQYSVAAVDLRHLELADVVMSHPHPLLPRASGIAERTQKDYRGVHERSVEGPTRSGPDAAGVTGRVHRSSGSYAVVLEQP
jgi:hypothetical protein